jgi:uncharacterized Fe-S cluster-containing MiaB family protein
MRTNEIEKDKSVIKDLRLIRDTISNELTGMTPEQIVAYLKNKKTLHPPKVFSSYEMTEHANR